MDASVCAVVCCGFLIVVQNGLAMLAAIRGVFENGDCCVITGTYVSIQQWSEDVFFITMRFQSLESEACGGSAQAAELARSRVPGAKHISASMPAFTRQH